MVDTIALHDEREVILNAKRRDKAAFAKLVEQYQRRAYAIAYGFVGNRDDALELAQEAFSRAYKAMARFDARLPFYPWLYRIVKNTCLNYLKKRRRRGETSLDGLMERGFDIACPNGNPRHEAAAGDLRRAISTALSRLSDGHREIIVLRHLHEHSYAEIAQCLGIPQGTVMSRLHAARKALKEVLEKHELAGDRPGLGARV